MKKVLQVGMIQIHPSMLEATENDTPAGYIHAATALVIEEDAPAGKVNTYARDGHKGDRIVTRPDIVALARQLHELVAQDAADDLGIEVRATSDAKAPTIAPRPK